MALDRVAKPTNHLFSRSLKEIIMAFDAYLKITGVTGEAKDDKHPGWIHLESYSFGGSNVGSARLGGGMGTGKADLQDFHFTTSMDKSVPDLLVKCCTGEHISRRQNSNRSSRAAPNWSSSK